MKLLTQNTSWEATTGTDTSVRGSRCLQNGVNVCADNVRKVIQRAMNDKFDFVCLQENAMGTLVEAGYTQNDHADGLETISILQSPNHTLLHSFGGALERGRPFQVCVFSTVVLINLHAGHGGRAINALSQIELAVPADWLAAIQMRPTIIAGDFNMRMPEEALFFGKPMKLSKELITCCDKTLGTGPNLQMRMQDQIQVSPTLDIRVETLLNASENKLHSDHLPVAASIT